MSDGLAVDPLALCDTGRAVFDRQVHKWMLRSAPGGISRNATLRGPIAVAAAGDRPND